MITSALARRARRLDRQRTAVVAYLRGNDWCFTLVMWQHLRISSGQLYVVLAQLEREGLVESRWQEPGEHPADQPRRRVYRVAP